MPRPFHGDAGSGRHLEELTSLARPLDTPAHLDPLLDRIGDSRYVLLGEASHGTSEYYSWRAELTRRLVEERGFTVVAVEGDWPDCQRINRWVRGLPGVDGGSAREVLAGFERWPTWMWANDDVAELVDWMRSRNQGRAPTDQVGFYGLDVYSLWDSLRAVLGYLEVNRPDAVAAAREAYRCFEPYAEDPQEYAWATRMVPTDCEDEVVGLLADTLRRSPYDGDDAETRFDAEQNAHVAVGAERYYRAMVRGDASSWNVRDTHMVDTLDRIVHHHGAGTKVVVWEHNTHVGDARGTTMAAQGLVNVGQLTRDRHADDGVVLVGFASAEGTVLAGRSWGAPAEVMELPPPPPGTHEDLLRGTGRERALLVFPRHPRLDWLERSRGHRAVGVVYEPERERLGNWVPTVMGRRYDALCYLDRTEALRPIEPAHVSTAEPETWPTNR